MPVPKRFLASDTFPNITKIMSVQAKLLDKYMGSAATGKVEWIGVRPGRKQGMHVLSSVQAIAGSGLAGDHRAVKNSASSRQVSLINFEDIQVVLHLLALKELSPNMLRRNIVVSGINLHAMRYQCLKIGEAVLELRAHCHPCARMEQALGKGAVLALYGHAGYCAVVRQSGRICIGDEVVRLESDNSGAV